MKFVPTGKWSNNERLIVIEKIARYLAANELKLVAFEKRMYIEFIILLSAGYTAAILNKKMEKFIDLAWNK